mgnify:CR=1 FL=1
MDDKKLGAVEARFADLIWQNAPIRSGELVKLCETELQWKKPTTYTVLRRLCQRGIFSNDDGIVSARISREEFYAMQSERFVEETFSGSLPSFLAAFTRRRSLSAAEIEEIRKMIDSYPEV